MATRKTVTDKIHEAATTLLLRDFCVGGATAGESVGDGAGDGAVTGWLLCAAAVARLGVLVGTVRAG